MSEQEKKILKMAIISSLPGCALPLFIVIIIAIFVSLGLLGDGGESSSGEKCVNLSGVNAVCNTITVEGEGTMSVDEYVAGVVGGEVGVFSGHPEIQKALSIAARTYSLNGATKDGNGNCTVPNGEHFQVYNGSAVTDSILDIVEETSGMVLVDENGNIKSTEYDSILLVQSYDSSGSEVTLKQQDLKIPKEWLIEVREPDISCPINSSSGKSMNNYRSSYGGYGCGHGRGMSQWGGLYLEMEKGYNYTEILDFFYGTDSDYKLQLASTKGATTNCTSTNNGNLQTLSTYNLNGNGLKVLDRTLTSSEMQELNNYIDREVDKAGYGTGAGIAAAGQALTYWMEQKGYFISYYWGGGHSSNFVGASSDWGSTKFGVDTNNGNNRPYYGMDCSGFVSWATRTACNVNFGVKVSGDWTGLGNGLSSLENAKPGDVLADAGHIQLVVKNNGDGTVIVAEEKGGSVGLVFNKVSSTSKKIVDMSQYYNNNCNTSR